MKSAVGGGTFFDLNVFERVAEGEERKLEEIGSGNFRLRSDVGRDAVFTFRIR
jgi:hypothetical protein